MMRLHLHVIKRFHTASFVLSLQRGGQRFQRFNEAVGMVFQLLTPLCSLYPRDQFLCFFKGLFHVVMLEGFADFVFMRHLPLAKVLSIVFDP